MIDLDDVREKMKENERQRLLSKHKYKVFFDERDNRWKTTLPDETKKNGRRLIAKRNKSHLDDAIIAYYAQIEDITYVEDNLYTLEKIFPKWLKYKATMTNATSYIRRIIIDWNKYYKDTEIVKVLLCDLTYLQLHDWAYNLVKNNSLNKKQYYNASIIMRQCLDYACEPDVGFLTTNPFSRVKVNKNLFTKLEKPKSNTQVFMVDEQKLICNEAIRKFEEHPWCTTPLIILLNFQLGLRISEICTIKWKDIEGNYLHVQRMETESFSIMEDGITATSNGLKVVPYTKSNAGDRLVYLNESAKKILHQLKETNMKYGYCYDDYIFIKSQGKTRGTTRSFSKYLYDLCVSSGVVAKSSHKIRKTYISSLFDKGVNINTIREQAGHEDERTSLNNYCFDQNVNSVIEEKLESASNKIVCI